MDEKQLEQLYKSLSSRFDIGDLNSFKAKMATADDRKRFYNAVSDKGFDLGDYDSYESRLAGSVKKKEPSPSNGGGEPSKAPSPLISASTFAIPKGGFISPKEDWMTRTTGDVKPQAPEKDDYVADEDDPVGSYLQPLQHKAMKLNAKRREKINLYANQDATAHSVPIELSHDRAKEIEQLSVEETNTRKAVKDVEQKASELQYLPAAQVKEGLNNLLQKKNPEINVDELSIEQIEKELPLNKNGQRNETAQLLFKKLKSDREVADVLSDSQTLEEAAAKYSYYYDKDLHADVQKAGDFSKMPPALKGTVLSAFVNNPSLREWAQSTPERQASLQQAETKLFEDPQYASFGRKMIGEAMGDAREQKGWNNAVGNIFDDTDGSRVTANDQLFDELVKSGELPETARPLYQKMRGKLHYWVPTSGGVENLLFGLKHGASNVSHFFTDPFTSGEEATNEALEKKYAQPGFKPKGLVHEIVTSTAQMTGELLPLIAISRGLGGAGLSKNLSNAIATGVVFEHPNRERAALLYPNDTQAQNLYTAASTGIDIGISLFYHRGAALKGLVGETKSEIADIVKKFASGEISEAAAKEAGNKAASSLFQKAQEFIVKTGEHNLKQSGQMAGFTLGHDLMDYVLGKKEFSEVPNDVIESGKAAFMSGGLISAMAAHGELSAKKIVSGQLYNIAKNPVAYEEAIRRNPKITEAQRGELLANIAHAKSIVSDLNNETELTNKQKATVLLHELNQKVLQDKLDNTTTIGLKERIKEQMKASNEAVKKVFEVRDNQLERVEEHKKSVEETVPQETKENEIVRTEKEPETLQPEAVREDNGGSENSVPDSEAGAGEAQAVSEAAKEPIVKEQPYQTKSGKYRVEYKEGKRVVVSKSGEPVSERVQKDVLREHDKNYNYNFGEKADTEKAPQFSNESEAKRWVVENSNNPAEVAEVYHSTEKETHPLSAKEQAIAEHGIGKVKESSYREFGDGNNINNNKARAYFNTKGESLDVIAKEISDNTGLEVEPQDIVDFIDRFPNGVSEATAKRDGEVRQAAAERFHELTGIDITDRIARQAALQALEPEVAAQATINTDHRIETEALPEEEFRKWLRDEADKRFDNNETFDNLDTYEQEFRDSSAENRSQSETESGIGQNTQEPSTVGTSEHLREHGAARSEENKAGDTLRTFAAKVREGKISKLGDFKTSTGFDVVWDTALESIAQALEGGAKLADAIEAGLKYVRSTDWYKSLTEKEKFDTAFKAHITGNYQQEAIRDLIEESQTDKSHNPVRKHLALSEVAQGEANKIKEATGLDVKGYAHTIDNSAINHILNEHGGEQERLRGQIPVTKDDLLLIPEIIESPDTIEYDGKSKIGTDLIRYTKTIGDKIYYIEEVRTGKKELAAKTMFKRKGGEAMASSENEPTLYTSETATSSLSSTTADDTSNLQSGSDTPKTTGIKNAVTKAEREAKGLDEVEVTVRRSFGKAFDTGKSMVDNGEINIRNMAKVWSEKPRPLSAEESAALIYDRMKLSNEYKNVLDKIEQASKNGDEAALSEARLEQAYLEEAINDNDVAARQTGYEQGLGLAARRMMIKEDYSMARLQQRARVAEGGEVPKEVFEKLEAQSKKIEELSKKIQEYEERQSKKSVQEFAEENAKLELEIRKAGRKQKTADIDKNIANIKTSIKEKLKVHRNRLNSNPVPIEIIPDLVNLAKEYIKKGIVKAEDLVDTIYTELKDDLDGITKKDLRDAISGYGKVRNLSKEEVDVKLRDLKGQMREISKLEGLQEGEPPLRSGMQRDKPSDELRELQRKVAQKMKEMGIEATPRDPQQVMKTALDAIKSRLRNQIADLEKQIQTGEKTPKKIGVAYDEEANALKEQRDSLKQVLEEIEGKPEISDEQRIKIALKAVEKSIQEYERRITEKDLSPQKKESKTPETPELKALREKRDGLKYEYKQMQDEAKPKKTPEEIALQAYKTRVRNQIADLEERITTGNFKKPPKRKTILDEEGVRLKNELEKAKDEADRIIRKRELANRSKIEKGIDFLVKWRRGVLLTSIPTLVKLGVAATSRITISPMEELWGGLLSKVPGINRIAKEAPREGGLNLKAESKAISQLWQKLTYEDILDNIKKGKGSLDRLFGKKRNVEEGIETDGRLLHALNFFGRLHAALKATPKRAEFFRSFEKRIEYAAKKGFDINDPVVQSTIAADAYIDANRAIFMNDNWATTGFQMFTHFLETKGKGGKVSASVMRMILPIVKVPTNYVREVSTYTFGIVKALPHIAQAMMKGVESLTPEQRDYVMRCLKKGSIGLAMLAVGYFNPKSVGGYYSGKRKDDDLKAGDLEVFDMHLPHWALHTPLLEVLQMGTTLRRVEDEYHKKGEDGTTAGIYKGTWGMLGQVPFFDQPKRIIDATTSVEKGGSYAGELVGGMFIPPDVQKIAKATDTDEKGEPNVRRPKGFVQTIEAKIPGLRENVPGEDPKIKARAEIKAMLKAGKHYSVIPQSLKKTANISPSSIREFIHDAKLDDDIVEFKNKKAESQAKQWQNMDDKEKLRFAKYLHHMDKFKGIVDEAVLDDMRSYKRKAL